MKRMKRFLSALTDAALILSLLLTPALAAGLSPIRGYDEAGFTDVASDWTYAPIKTCYELGLMSGQGGGKFNPGGTVAVAEGVAVAARVHSLWRGGGGTFPAGAPWYQSAVDYAARNGIIAPGQFSDFTAAATRAQLAGMLARALPQEGYAPINSVTSLPDVDDSTPGAADIFKLYNAGIVSGTDAYGTFAPNNTITRAEMAAILCRLVQPGTRVTFTLQPKPAIPADLTVRSSSKLLMLNGRPIYGLVDIGGEPYLPLALGEGNDAPLSGVLSCYEYDGKRTLHFYPDRLSSVLPDYSVAPPQGNVLGTARPGPVATVSNGYKNERDVTLLTLDGHFPMVKAADLFKDYTVDGKGAVISDQGSVLCVDLPRYSWETPPEVTREPDLVGQALANLLRSNPKDTVKAIHDYLVNTLTYDPFTAASEAAYEKASEQYQLQHNRILACKYGVCQDYAELFQEMCLRAGIPCEFVSGTAGGGGHAWNRVCLDGKWSYVDCTWDDPISKKPVLRYDYYLVGPDVMVKSHFWEGDDYPMPKDYDPAWEQLDPNNITSADMFRKCFVAQIAQGKTSIKLRVTKSGAYGGTGCIYAYGNLGWSYMKGGYNSKTKCYEYTVEYW